MENSTIPVGRKHINMKEILSVLIAHLHGQVVQALVMLLLANRAVFEEVFYSFVF